MQNKNTKKPANIKTSFDSKSLTNFSGIKVISKFMRKIGIESMFDMIDLNLHHNIKFSNFQILSTIILGIFSGFNRVSKIESFSRDPLIQKLLCLATNIDADTIFNRIKRFGMNENNQIMNIIGKLSSKVHDLLKTNRDILDLDSTVHTLYGHQEGVAKGFNSSKKGAKSYHPIMCFLNSTKECLLSWLRPGDTYTANNSHGFIEQAFGLLPSGIKYLLVRADSGFFNDRILQAIELRKYTQYLIKVKLKNLKTLLSDQDWESIPFMPNWQMTEFMYKCADWEKARKFVALRKKVLVHTEDGLFKTSHYYDYFCYVTNIYDSPLEIHRLYGDRGESENWIEQVKRQMFAGSMITQDFWANETLWQMSVLAYNLSLWMRKLSDEKSWREEPNTFRAWFVQVAGKIVINGRNLWLKMYEAYHYKDRWLKIEKAVDNLVFA